MTGDDALSLVRRAVEIIAIAPHDYEERLRAARFTPRRLRVLGRAILRDGLTKRDLSEYVAEVRDDIRASVGAQVAVNGHRMRWDIAEAWLSRPRLHLSSKTRAGLSRVAFMLPDNRDDLRRTTSKKGDLSVPLTPEQQRRDSCCSRPVTRHDENTWQHAWERAMRYKPQNPSQNPRGIVVLDVSPQRIESALDKNRASRESRVILNA